MVFDKLYRVCVWWIISWVLLGNICVSYVVGIEVIVESRKDKMGKEYDKNCFCCCDLLM